MAYKFLKLKWMIVFGVVFGKILLAGLAACAADTVGLVDSQKIAFQHPRFDEASRILIFLTTSLEGSAPQMLLSESDPERREMISKFSTQVNEFATLDRAIAAENDPERQDRLWLDRQIKLSEFEASLMGPILDECSQAIREVMTLRSITVVLELDSVFYGGTDITDDVIQRLARLR